MCNYKYKYRKHQLSGKRCIYPVLYLKYSDQFAHTKQLPIDSEGYCIFHSTQSDWKSLNGFANIFNELFDVTIKIFESDKTFKWPYNFSGFYFSDEKPIVIDGRSIKNSFDFTFTEFTNGLTLSNSNLPMIDLSDSHFDGKLVIDRVTINGNINCMDAVFDNSVVISDSRLNGYNYFMSCKFRSLEKNVDSVFSFKNCPSIDYLNFENSNFEASVVFEKIVFQNEVVFNKSIFLNEFIFHKNEINGAVSFNESEFVLAENLNPMYSSADFSNIKINKNGRLVFRGVKPLDDMVKGELQLVIDAESEGIVSFENFNLNKLYPPAKLRVLELEKTGKAEIRKGCRKYYSQTDIFEIEASNANQKLILDIVSVFCNYFEIRNNYNLGVEIVERNVNSINYFFFTDELISKEELENRIRQNEFNLWETFSNLSKSAGEIISVKDIEIKNCLIDIAGLFLKIGNQIQHNNFIEDDLNKIMNSISIEKSSVNIPNLFKEVFNRYLNFTKNPPIIYMGDTFNNYGGNIEQFGKNNYKTVITDNTNISNEQKTYILEAINEIEKEKIPEEKKNKVAKFIKEFGSTIGEVAVKMVLAAVS